MQDGCQLAKVACHRLLGCDEQQRGFLNLESFSIQERVLSLDQPRGSHVARPQRVDDLINLIATASHAPRFAVSIDKRMTDAVPRLPLRIAGAQSAGDGEPHPQVGTRQPAPAGESMQQMPGAREKRVVTVTGSEDWDGLRGFGKSVGAVVAGDHFGATRSQGMTTRQP